MSVIDYYKVTKTSEITNFLNNFLIPDWRIKDVSAKCRTTTNNLNKNTLARNLQTDRENGLERPKKSLRFPVWVLRGCERATLARRKGHSCVSTVPLLQVRSGSFRPILGIKHVSIKFNWLIVNVLKVSPKSPICGRAGCSLRISQAERLKMNK